MTEPDATAVAMAELKFASDPSTGEFEGYGAIFGSQDSHGDLILPGAFAASLAGRTAAKRTLPMYVQHGPHVGGDHLPAGVWSDVREDQTGLRVKGRISGMDTERGKTLHALVKDGALSGLSIEYNVPRGSATYGKAAGEPRRTIKAANLHGISLVADPSHAMARVAEVKAAAVRLDQIETKLAAGERLSDQEWGDLLRGRCGLSPEQADRALRANLRPEVKSALDAVRSAIAALTSTTAA